MKRILGLDPGTLVMGFGVVEKHNGDARVVDYGVLKLSSRDAFPDRLRKIYEEVSRIVTRYAPSEIAIEDVFYANNVKVALKMGHARGVAIVAAVNHDLPTFEYSPREIKMSIAGHGSASKEQVQRMLPHLLNLDCKPEPLDASDALAVALCHIHRLGSKV